MPGRVYLILSRFFTQPQRYTLFLKRFFYNKLFCRYQLLQLPIDYAFNHCQFNLKKSPQILPTALNQSFVQDQTFTWSSHWKKRDKQPYPSPCRRFPFIPAFPSPMQKAPKEKRKPVGRFNVGGGKNQRLRASIGKESVPENLPLHGLEPSMSVGSLCSVRVTILVQPLVSISEACVCTFGSFAYRRTFRFRPSVSWRSVARGCFYVNVRPCASFGPVDGRYNHVPEILVGSDSGVLRQPRVSKRHRVSTTFRCHGCAKFMC